MTLYLKTSALGLLGGLLIALAQGMLSESNVQHQRWIVFLPSLLVAHIVFLSHHYVLQREMGARGMLIAGVISSFILANVSLVVLIPAQITAPNAVLLVGLFSVAFTAMALYSMKPRRGNRMTISFATGVALGTYAAAASWAPIKGHVLGVGLILLLAAPTVFRHVLERIRRRS